MWFSGASPTFLHFHLLEGESMEFMALLAPLCCLMMCMIKLLLIALFILKLRRLLWNALFTIEQSRLSHGLECNRLIETAQNENIQQILSNGATAIDSEFEESDGKAFDVDVVSVSLQMLVSLTSGAWEANRALALPQISAAGEALELEANDGKALEMMAAASRAPSYDFLSISVDKMFAECKASASLVPMSITEPPQDAELEKNEFSVCEKMLEETSSEPIPSPNLTEEEEPQPFEFGDCSICSSHLFAGTETSDPTADLWEQMDMLEYQGATLEEQTAKFISLNMPRAKVSRHEENEATWAPAHGAFIGDSTFDDEQQERFDSFWLALDEDLCHGAEMMPQVLKLLGCFEVPGGTSAQHFYIGNDVRPFETCTSLQFFNISDEDVLERLPWTASST
eukprot:Skav228125  [mRNA]  locus=scaffold1220:267634:268827:+ [translate_table: standard]